MNKLKFVANADEPEAQINSASSVMSNSKTNISFAVTGAGKPEAQINSASSVMASMTNISPLFICKSKQLHKQPTQNICEFSSTPNRYGTVDGANRYQAPISPT